MSLSRTNVKSNEAKNNTRLRQPFRQNSVSQVSPVILTEMRFTKMSAPGQDTFPTAADEMEEMEQSSSEEDEMEEDEEENEGGEGKEKIYVPGREVLNPGEQLEMDRSAYRLYHECQTGSSYALHST